MSQNKASIEKTMQSALKHKRAGTEISTAVVGIEAMLVSGITTTVATVNPDARKVRRSKAALAHKVFGQRMADAVSTLDAIVAAEGYADGVEATASLATTTPIVLTSSTAAVARNTTTFITQVVVAAPNPTNTVLVAFTGTAAAITCTVTPNDGTNNPANAAATASMATTTPIVLTSVAKGTARNTNTLTLQILAAAANPTNTVIAAFTGTADAITLTITPNDGTNNAATPVDITTAQVAELINTGLVTGKVITLTDASSRRILQTATGGGAVAVADAGEGDGVVGTFSGGTNIPVTVTTANLVQAITAGIITGKVVTITDASSLRALQIATGGGAAVMADAGEGDGVVGTFASGQDSMAVATDKVLSGAPHKQNLRKVAVLCLAEKILGLEVANMVTKAEIAIDMLLATYGVGGNKADAPTAAKLALIKTILIS